MDKHKVSDCPQRTRDARRCEHCRYTHSDVMGCHPQDPQPNERQRTDGMTKVPLPLEVLNPTFPSYRGMAFRRTRETLNEMRRDPVVFKSSLDKFAKNNEASPKSRDGKTSLTGPAIGNHATARIPISKGKHQEKNQRRKLPFVPKTSDL